MKRLYFLAVIMICIMLIGCHSKNSIKRVPGESKETVSLLSFQKYITPEFLHKRDAVIADDSMQGRRTGSIGQKKAARYLISQYKKMGIKPAQDSGAYLQKFKLNATRTDSVIFKTYKTTGNSQKLINRSVNSKDSFGNYMRRFGGAEKVKGPIVFAGFGIKADSLGINQLRGVGLKGKWVMVFTDFPQVVGRDTLFTNRRAFFRKWFQNIRSQHIAGLLMISGNSPQEFEKEAQGNSDGFGRPAGMQLKYRSRKGKRPNISFDAINPGFAAKLLHLQNGPRGIKKLKQKLVKNIKKFKSIDMGYSLTQIPHSQKVTLKTANVAVLLKGGDPKVNDQVVVLSAHYDHLGVGRPDSTGDRIYNGADDDGSGTSALLNMAHAFAKARDKGKLPRRSILFLHFTGEEEGLLGSRYYSDHPIIPTKNTVADLNSDMLGRVDPKHQKMGQKKYVYEIGGDLISSGLDSLFRLGNSQTGKVTISERYNTLTDPHQFYRRSDHWNFGRLGVPFIFFFTGVHKDYHQPGDEVQKVKFKKLSKIVRSIYATSVLVANTDEPPKVDNQVFINATKQRK